MSLNPTLDLLLAVNGLVFVGAALLLWWLAIRSRVNAPSREVGQARPALLATVAVAAGEHNEPAPRRFRFSPAAAPRRDGRGAVLNLHIQVDAQLIERISEFLTSQDDSAREKSDGQKAEGCVIVVADALPPAIAAHSGAAYLNGASAFLSLARAIAEAPERPFHTLLIDAGSPAWSIYSVDGAGIQSVQPGDAGLNAETENTAQPYAAPDILPLPEVQGVYDIVAGRLTLDECLLNEDDSPLLLALAPGEMPLRWAELIRSSGMRRLLAAARAVAEVVLVYSPRAAEYPEQARQLADWSDGVIIVGAELGRGANRQERDRRQAVLDFEQSAARLLELATSATSATTSPPLLGRIGLDFTSVPKGSTPARVLEDSSAE